VSKLTFNINKEKLVDILRHYVYAAAASVSAQLAIGNSSGKDLLIAALSGAFGPILAALDPKMVSYGIGYLPPVIGGVAEAVVAESTKAKKAAKKAAK
jgi:hypothetical protein